MDSLESLEKWRSGHKRRSVAIDIDNGYGASAWAVTLRSVGRGEVCVTEADLMRDGEGWPGLAKTILAAIAEADEMGL